MDYCKIKSEDQYREALNRFLEICDKPKDENEVKELFLLMDLMDKYERDNCCCN